MISKICSKIFIMKMTKICSLFLFEDMNTTCIINKAFYIMRAIIVYIFANIQIKDQCCQRRAEMVHAMISPQAVGAPLLLANAVTMGT